MEMYQGERSKRPRAVEAENEQVEVIEMYDGHWYSINIPDPSTDRHLSAIPPFTRRHSDPELIPGRHRRDLTGYIVYNGKDEFTMDMSDSASKPEKVPNGGVVTSDPSYTNGHTGDSPTIEFYFGASSNGHHIESTRNRTRTQHGHGAGVGRTRPRHRRRHSDPNMPISGEHTFIETARDEGNVSNGFEDMANYGYDIYVSHHGRWLGGQYDSDKLILPETSTYMYQGRPESNGGYPSSGGNRKYRLKHRPEYERAHTDFSDRSGRHRHSHLNGHGPNPGKSQKGRDASTGCHQFLRYATTLFTFIVFIAGAGLLGLGIYLLGSDYGAQEMSSVLGNSLYQVVTYFLIISGAAIVIISMCGCCGALRESKCMLIIFTACVSLIVLALITAVIIVFVFRSKLENNIVHSMEDVVVKKYGVDLQNHTNNRMVTDTMNWLQKELKCCGVTGGVNSTTSWGIYKHSDWYKGFETGKPYVPQSCCVQDGDLNICTGITSIEGPPSQGPPLLGNMVNNEHLYTTGCYDEIINYIQSHLIMIGVASIGTVVVMLFGLFFSIYLYRRIDTEEY